MKIWKIGMLGLGIGLALGVAASGWSNTGLKHPFDFVKLQKDRHNILVDQRTGDIYRIYVAGKDRCEVHLIGNMREVSETK